MLYEHKTRSDGCTEEVSIGLLLAQKGLATCMDYEKATYAESDSTVEEGCESEEKTLEFQESELMFAPEDSETGSEPKNSSSVDLLEKILAPKASFNPPKQQLLKPSELTSKRADQTCKDCDTVEKPVELGSTVNTDDGIPSPTTENETKSRDGEEPLTQSSVSSDHVTEVKSTDTEVNQHSVESSV